MIARTILALLLVLGPVMADAATYPVINGTGATQQMNAQTDASGAFSSRNVFCDGTNPDQCAAVTGAGQLNALVVQPTPGSLNATVYQPTASSLNATVSQGTGTNLHVVVDTCTSGCSGTAGFADLGTFTFGTTLQLPAGCVYQTNPLSNPLTTGTAGSIQCTSFRSVFTNLRNASGTEIGTASTPLQVSIANTGANSTPLVDTATLNQNGAVLSVTNGLFTNLLQSNAVLSAGNPIYAANVPLSGAGLNMVSAIVANNTTSVAVGSSAAHQMYGIDGFSISTSTPVYVKFYNATQGSTTCGSGTPVARYVIPASGAAAGSGFVMHERSGVAFTTALTYCVTAGIADNDTTAPSGSTYILNVYYK